MPIFNLLKTFFKRIFWFLELFLCSYTFKNSLHAFINFFVKNFTLLDLKIEVFFYIWLTTLHYQILFYSFSS